MDVLKLAKQLGIGASVASRAKALLSMAVAKTPGGLGQGEVAMAAVCLELACLAANEHRDIPRETFVKSSCVNAKIFANVHKTLRQIMNLNRKVDLQHLIIRFGCAPVRPQVVEALQKYKERFIARLASEERAKADFTRPTFLAVVFFLVARKNKVKVDQKALMEMMCVARGDFVAVHSSMLDLCSDEIAVVKKRKAKKVSSDDDKSEEGQEEEVQRSNKKATTRHRGSHAQTGQTEPYHS